MDRLIFLYLSIFPLGKLTGVLPDLLILLICVLFVFKNKKLQISNMVLIFMYSLLFSLSFFNLSEIITGSLYLLRFTGYILFSQVILDEFGKSKIKKETLFNSLILIGVFIAVFGWIQYLFLPDIRALKTLGWDDHYFRLVSTFIDPAFTGILLVLTEILVVIKTIKNKNIFNYLLNLFLIITILLTYSRASFLALAVANMLLFLKFRQKLIIILFGIFLILIPFLPKNSGGEGVNLARTYSIVDRWINYKDSLKLIEKSPLFGIGFNNVCIATNRNPNSHSCSGLDNSILFVVATTGIVGLIIFAQTIIKIIKNTNLESYGWGLIISFAAILVHGMFTNTYFYNFILGWVAILIGISRKKIKVKE